jgi:hypothetical protein
MNDQPSSRTAPPPRRGERGKVPASRRARRRRPWWTKPVVVGPVVVAVAAAVVIVVVTAGGGGSNAAVGYKTGTLAVYGAKGPEIIPLEAGPVLAPPNPSLSGSTIDGVACGATEQLASHTHTHLIIFVDGQPRSVPLAIGMVPQVQVSSTASGQFAQGSSVCLYWLHTHAQDGIIHVEAPAAHQYVLGQFFDIWGQPLSTTQVGPAKGAVTVTVDGKAWTGDPRNAPLIGHGQIVINVGTPIVTPPPVSFSGSGL